MLALLLTLGSALASPAELYGFGAAAMGRAGGGVSLDGDAGSALLNPAALAGHEHSQLLVGFAAVRFDFADVPPVYWDTNRDGLIDQHDEPLQVGGYDPGDGFMLGLRRPIGKRFGVGAAMFVPTQRLLRLQTTDPQVPNYFMYRNRTQRYALAVGFGGMPVRSLYIGGGFRILSRSTIDVTMTIDAVVDGDNEGGGDPGVEDVVALEAKVHDMTFDLQPAVVPVLALRWEVGEVVTPLEGLALGFTWRNEGGIPVDVNLDAQLNARAQDLGELDPVSMAALAQVYVSIYDHYMPMQFMFGGSWSFEDTFHIYLDTHYTRWSAMRLNSTELISSELDATMADLSELEFVNGHDVGEIQWKDTWSLRTGTELNLPRFDLPGRLGWVRPGFRGGFGYEPTPLVAQTGHTALLDADRMIFGVGASVAHGAIWDIVEGPVRWDAFLQYHSLARGTLARPETEEMRAGYPVDGQPVPIGGRFLATGLQWSFDY